MIMMIQGNVSSLIIDENNFLQQSRTERQCPNFLFNLPTLGIPLFIQNKKQFSIKHRTAFYSAFIIHITDSCLFFFKNYNSKQKCFEWHNLFSEWILTVVRFRNQIKLSILQTFTAIPFSRASSQPRDQTQVFLILYRLSYQGKPKE